MNFDPQKHHRRSIRLKNYDYSQAGLYYITICSKKRDMLFGAVLDGKMVLNVLGQIVEYTWHDLINHNNHIQLDAFIIMPNHVHGIIVINEYESIVTMVGASSEPAPTKTTNAMDYLK